MHLRSCICVCNFVCNLCISVHNSCVCVHNLHMRNLSICAQHMQLLVRTTRVCNVCDCVHNCVHNTCICVHNSRAQLVCTTHASVCTRHAAACVHLSCVCLCARLVCTQQEMPHAQQKSMLAANARCGSHQGHAAAIMHAVLVTAGSGSLLQWFKD